VVVTASLIFILYPNLSTAKQSQIPESADYRPESDHLSTKQMKEDLAIFRAVREATNSVMYRYRTKTYLDSVYLWAESEVQKPLSPIDFYKILLILTDVEGSCHNATYLFRDVYDYLPKDRGFFPYDLKNIEGKIRMNSAKEAIPVGSEILSINGISNSGLIAAFSKYYTTDGYNITAKERASVEDSYGWRFLFEFGMSDIFKITFKQPGKIRTETITVKSLSLEEKKQTKKRKHSAPYDAKFDFEQKEKFSAVEISPTTMLLNFRIFNMAENAEDPAYKTFCQFLDSVFVTMQDKKMDNLIIDIRNNPGGNDPNYETVFTHLAEKPFRENTHAHIIFNEIPYAQYFKWTASDNAAQKEEKLQLEGLAKEFFPTYENGQFLQAPVRNPYYYPDSLRFTGNLYLLIDEHVASAASHFASLVRAYTKATIVGVECSGGYYGHNGHFPIAYKLPNSNITTKFSIVYVEQDVVPHLKQPIGRGIIPDVPVSQSFADFMSNEDTQMKRVLKLIQEKQ